MERRKPVHLFDKSGPAGTKVVPDPNFLVATTPTLEGRPIEAYLGLVMGEAIIAPHLFRDFAASVSSIFGGRSVAYETPLHDARNLALAEAIEVCKQRQANALVGVDIDYESIEGGLWLVSVTGTAVRVKAAGADA